MNVNKTKPSYLLIQKCEGVKQLWHANAITETLFSNQHITLKNKVFHYNKSKHSFTYKENINLVSSELHVKIAAGSFARKNLGITKNQPANTILSHNLCTPILNYKHFTSFCTKYTFPVHTTIGKEEICLLDTNQNYSISFLLFQVKTNLISIVACYCVWPHKHYFCF